MLLLGTPAILCLLDRWRELGRVWQALVAAALVLIALPMREVFGLSITRQVMGTGHPDGRGARPRRGARRPATPACGMTRRDSSILCREFPPC